MSRDQTNEAVIETMLTLGGNFIQHLARAYRAADAENQARIRVAFADEWERYVELATLRPRPTP
jgi:hypothetical protein